VHYSYLRIKPEHLPRYNHFATNNEESQICEVFHSSGQM
jgi:hypothetical protein